MDRKVKVFIDLANATIILKVNFKRTFTLCLYKYILLYRKKSIKKMALLFNEEEFKIGTYDESVRDSLRRLLFTWLGEIPGLPEVGSRLYLYFFGPVDEQTANDILEECTFLIQTYEPRVTLKKMIVNFDGFAIQVTINYVINSDPTQQDRTAEFYETKTLTV